MLNRTAESRTIAQKTALRTAPVPRPTGVARLAPYIVLALTVLAGILRTYALASKGLWLDEAFSVWLADQPLGELLAWLLRVDQHPPLYYALLHFWVVLFGDSAFSVRMLSAVFGTLTIPVIYLVGRRLLGTTGGLLAATILTVSPFHVRFAQETRMYTLLTLNASLAMFLLATILTDPRATTVPFGTQLEAYFRSWREARRAPRPGAPSGSPIAAAGPGARARQPRPYEAPPIPVGAGSPRPASPHLASPRPAEGARLGYTQDLRDSADWATQQMQSGRLPLSSAATDLAWLGFVVFTVATILSHNTAVLFPLAANIFVLGFIFWRKRFGAPSELDANPGLPARLVPPSLHNWLASQAVAFLLWSPWLVPFAIQAIGVYGEFWIQKPTALTVAATVGNFFSAHLPLRAALIGPVAIGFGLLLALGAIYLRRRLALLAFLVTMMAAPFIGELLVSLRRPIFYDRTLIWTTIPLFLLLAAGLLQLRYRPYILGGLAFIVAVNAVSLQQYFTRFEKEQWREAAAYVAEQVRKDDLLLFNATWVQIPFDFYFHDANRPVEERGAPVDLFDRGILEPKMARTDLPRLRELIRGRERVWLIYSHNWYTDPQNLIPGALGAELKLLEERPFVGLDVRLYGAPQ